MSSKGMGGHCLPIEGKTNDWLTPPEILAALPAFDLDPCASERQPWRTAKTMWTVKDDGLSRDWSGFGSVWLNLPYGPHVWKWLERGADYGRGIALIFARTETEGFHRCVWNRATGLFFFAGRLHFHRPVSGERSAFNAGSPSVLVAYGGGYRWLESFKMPGRFVKL